MTPTYLSKCISNTTPTHSHIPVRRTAHCPMTTSHTVLSLNSYWHGYLDLAWGKHTAKAPTLDLKSPAYFEISAQVFFQESFPNSFPQDMTFPTTMLTMVTQKKKLILNICTYVLHTKFLTSNKSLDACSTSMENK